MSKIIAYNIVSVYIYDLNKKIYIGNSIGFIVFYRKSAYRITYAISTLILL